MLHLRSNSRFDRNRSCSLVEKDLRSVKKNKRFLFPSRIRAQIVGFRVSIRRSIDDEKKKKIESKNYFFLTTKFLSRRLCIAERNDPPLRSGYEDQREYKRGTRG